jgi:hypothetical protein
MIWLKLPLKAYIYLLNFALICLVVMGYFVNISDTSSSFKFIFVLMISLIGVNFLNMRLTLTNYITNSNKPGPKGERGERGARGFTGDADICGNCKPTKEYYGGEVNDNNETVNNDKLKMGYCKFPFVFNNQLWNEPVKLMRDDINDAAVNGWCATEVNDDLSYKKYGYVNNSDKNILNIKKIKKNYKDKQTFIDTNSGIIDITLVSNKRSKDAKCPDGFTKLNYDLNTDANGNYIYLCKKYGISDIGIKDIDIVDGSSEGSTKCRAGYKELEINLNDGVPNLATKDKIRMCIKKGSINDHEKFVKDIKLLKKKDEKCPNNYKKIKTNLNQGTNRKELYFCITTEHTAPMIDAAFVWEEDKNLYFFKNENYWRVMKSNKVEGPFLINSFWGKIIGNLDSKTKKKKSGETIKNTGIDAIYSDLFDNNTYIFKGNMVYSYDKKEEKIKDGFPKKINDVWTGFPDNIDFIDAIYADNLSNTVYFIKNKTYYKLNNSSKQVESYKKIANLWSGGPKNMIVKAMFNYNDKTYLIESDMVYEVNHDNTFNSKGPKLFNEVFPNLIDVNKIDLEKSS